MNNNLNKEKLPLSQIAKLLKRIYKKRRRRAEELARTRKAMSMVETRLKQWVAEGKHRIKYGCLDDIIEDLGLTSVELSLYCSTKLKKTFLSWRKELRMEEAKKMLLESPEIPACKIGKSLGITDKADFRHQFKAHTGFTPSEWRKKFSK